MLVHSHWLIPSITPANYQPDKSLFCSPTTLSRLPVALPSSPGRRSALIKTPPVSRLGTALGDEAPRVPLPRGALLHANRSISDGQIPSPFRLPPPPPPLPSAAPPVHQSQLVRPQGRVSHAVITGPSLRCLAAAASRVRLPPPVRGGPGVTTRRNDPCVLGGACGAPPSASRHHGP